jgi:hypothetical protein
MDRRSFLKTVGVVGVAAVCGGKVSDAQAIDAVAAKAKECAQSAAVLGSAVKGANDAMVKLGEYIPVSWQVVDCGHTHSLSLGEGTSHTHLFDEPHCVSWVKMEIMVSSEGELRWNTNGTLYVDEVSMIPKRGTCHVEDGKLVWESIDG